MSIYFFWMTIKSFTIKYISTLKENMARLDVRLNKYIKQEIIFTRNKT